MHQVFRASTSRRSSPKLKLLARALEHAQELRGRADRRLVSPPRTISGGRGGGAVLRGHHRLPPCRRRRGARRAGPRAAARRGTCAQGLAARTPRRARRVRDRAEVRRRRPSRGRPGSRASSSIEEITRRSSARVRRGAQSRSRWPIPRPSSRRGSCWSTSRRGRRPSRSSRACAGGPAHRRVTRGRSTRSPRACSCSCRDGRRDCAGSFVSSTSATVTEIDLRARRRRPATRRETSSSGTTRRARGARRGARRPPRRRWSCRSRRRRPSRSAASARTGCTGAGVAVEMPTRGCAVHSLDVIRRERRGRQARSPGGLGTYIRSIAEALGGHCVSLRRTEVGPFSVEEATQTRVVPLDDARRPPGGWRV